ncbi:MAG TPA: sensor histidine kinase, partial [Caulobacter sp.]|nr:sensor histidine kinase [Caulobacter sp.]
AGWEMASLRELAEHELRPYGQEKILIEGEDVELAPKQALALGMVFHELATNAAKYGALSTPAGKVAIAWDHAGDNEAVLTWAERDGPPVAPPDRKGFGTRLLDRGLSADLGGQPKLTFDAAGVRAVLPIRLA